jgi:glycosyltransferase involved in cell wall biosynthesis
MHVNIEKVAGKTASDAKFSIVIPSWNNLAYLQLCIESIKKHSKFTHQIIVHINEGIDGSLDWVKSQPDISYSYSKENVGVCYALNSCRELVTTNYLLYINDDMYVCPGWDAPLAKAIDETPHNLFFFSSTAIELKAQSNCSIEYDFGKDITSFKESDLLSKYDSLSMQDWQGATWPPNIVHIKTWDAVGGYSNEFSPGMYSDPDFSMKLWNAGVRLFRGISESRVYHFGSISVKRVKRNKGYFTFIKKWGFTSSTLSKYYLRRGKKYTGSLPEATVPVIVHVKNFIKRLQVRFSANQF